MKFALYGSIPPTIKKYFNDENPLGPIAAENISDWGVAAFLLNPETDAFRGVLAGSSILLGRRGAGKSALLNMLVDRANMNQHLSQYYGDSETLKSLGKENELTKPYFITVRINAPKEMAEVDKIIRQNKFSTVEGAADAWKDRILHNLLVHLLNNPRLIKNLPAKLAKTLRSIVAINGFDASNPLTIREVIPAIRNASVSRPALLRQLDIAMSESRMKALVLIDTMEEYKIRDSAVSDVVAGLLYEISRQASNGGAFEIKAALPTEIYRQVKDSGAPGKYAAQTEFIHWRPDALTQIAVHRALLYSYCLSPQMFDRMRSHVADKRQKIDSRIANSVLSELLPSKMINEAGKQETSVNLILRHTLLLPRQMLNIISLSIKAARRSGQRYHIEPEHLLEGLHAGSDTILREVFTAYKHVYPEIGSTAPQYLGYCLPVMTYGDFHEAYNQTIKGRYHHDYTTDFSAFLRAMIDCGLIGVVTDESRDYHEGKFAYNYIGDVNFTSKDRLAVHPAAVRRYELMGRESAFGGPSSFEMKAVLPFGSFVGDA